MSSIVLYLVAIAALAVPTLQIEVDDACLECLCYASSFCNANFQRQRDVFGLYKMTNSYWLDGGSLTVNSGSSNNQNAFMRCASDPECAGKTVVNYMKRYAKDCNNDGVIDCIDFALIHRLGPFRCRWEGDVDAAYWTRFNSCFHMNRRSEAESMGGFNDI